MWVEKHGPTWRIRDTIAGKKATLQSGYATKTAARDAMRQAQADKLRGEQLVPRGGRLLVADFVDIWLPGYEASLKPSAAHSEPSRIRNHILPLLGQYELDEVDPLTVQRWVANLLAGKGPSSNGRPRKPIAVKTVHNCHGILFGIMQAAVRQRLIRSNPCSDTQLPKRVHKEMRFLTEPETGRLLAALPPHWRPLVLLLIATGLRWGEAVGLQVGQVDVLAKVPSLRVIRALHELSGSARIVFTEPKTARSRRTVTFTKQVADVLLGLVAGKGPSSNGRPRKPIAVKTVHNCHGILFGIMHAAVRQRLIRSNPCADTQLPKRVHKEMRFLTEPETGRLLAALPPHWRPLVLLLIATGLRWGEAVGLQVGQVDVLAKVPSLRVIRALHELSGSARIVFTEPKTARSRRTVTFTKQVADVLLGLVAGKDREDLVFHAPRGGPARTRNFRRTWLKATDKAGLAGLRVHDLRHSHAAALISAGVPLTAIQHRLGHSSIAVTSDLYGHLLPQVDTNILAAVAAALASIDPEVLAAELDEELATL
jgi:integrase